VCTKRVYTPARLIEGYLTTVYSTKHVLTPARLREGYLTSVYKACIHPGQINRGVLNYCV